MTFKEAVILYVKKIPKGKVHDYVQTVILESIIEILSNEKQFDLLEKASSSKKPFKIMLLGINGAGKTTTTAKIAHLLSKNNLKVVLCASDTFRAAAVEQLESHANTLGLKIIKRDYGSDPTSVAFDATNYANAHKIDVVLIDTAGRQDTNTNLLNEMKKMSRVISPDLKLYIGESIAGSAILDQVQSFNREIGLDGVILTKLDCDPKGGTMLSLSKVTGIPIVAVTLGQKYDDIEVFDPQKIAKKIVS
jgi:fused signal recognition particle receptor